LGAVFGGLADEIEFTLYLKFWVCKDYKKPEFNIYKKI
jgi:hypothetical protein